MRIAFLRNLIATAVSNKANTMNRKTCARTRTPGFRARRVWANALLPMVFAAALTASPAAFAEQSSASGNQPLRTSASVNFRIVIPETVRFERGQEQPGPTRHHTSRTVEVVDGQQVVTVARP